MKLITSLLALLPTHLTLITAASLLDRQTTNDRTVKISKFALTGNGCPDKTSGSVKYVDNATLTLIFDKFQAFNVPGQGSTRTTSLGCDITIDLDYASRFRDGNLTEQIRGEGTIGRNASGGLVIGTKWVYEGRVDNMVSQVS